MDDLNGLDWPTSSKPNAPKAPIIGAGNYFTSLRATPPPTLSGRSTPTPTPASVPSNAPVSVSKSSTADSFSNLVSFGSSNRATLTLQEQQERLQAEKSKREAERKRQYDAQFGNPQFWDGLESKSQASNFTPSITSRTSTPVVWTASPNPNRSTGEADGGDTSVNGDGDLFASSNADTKVDNSSYYLPPVIAKDIHLKSHPPYLTNMTAWGPAVAEELGSLGDDDDPFGLGKVMEQRRVSLNNHSPTDSDGDELLGDLAKPVEEVKRKTRPSPAVEETQGEISEDMDDPWDKAVAELVDMGFSAENSRRALIESGTGLNVQAAVEWLLNDAHRQAKDKAQNRTELHPENDSRPGLQNKRSERSVDHSRKESIPAWLRREDHDILPRNRDGSRSPANSDVDISRTAGAVGSNILKTANSLWKTSQKKVQKAVAEFSQDSDPGQPKWMRSIGNERQQPSRNPFRLEDEEREVSRQHEASDSAPGVTDEAMLLEADSGLPPGRTKPGADPRFLTAARASSRDLSPASSNQSSGRSTPAPRWQQTVPSAATDPRSHLSKQVVEEQSAQAYVSPARRKKAAPPPNLENEPDLLFGHSTAKMPSSGRISQPNSKAVENWSRASKVSKLSTPIPVRPKPPSRMIPPLSASALAASTKNRLTGTEHFKRGDYASAHSAYSLSLSVLAPNHPIVIILLCNRSLTALKTGDPKSAVADADTALALIGPSRGEEELIDLGDGSDGARKPMKEFWGKAVMRKAEALEQMERWKDAGIVWKGAVEAGVGGATSVQGRQRCEKALAPKPVSRPAFRPSNVSPNPRASALSDLASSSTKRTEAVNRLREANAAAEKVDDEKFALSDSVDARISKWRDGRKDNLRALLSGMDQVLCEGSEWKKVGMHELVVKGRVKIIYMKAIARVHPDKLPQDASTEMKMISASVFATLNEAWDKFKTENDM